MFAVSEVIECYARMVAYAVPIAAVFGFGNLIVDTVLTAAFGGGLKIGGVRR